MDVSKEVAIGADIREFVKEANDLNRIKERIESFKKGNYAMQHYELSILLPNGETRFLDVLGSPIKIKDKIESVLITAYDITSRKKAELKIKEQNEEFEVLNEELLQTNNELFAAIQREEEIIERFNLAMQATSDGLWDWDLLTNKVYFSLGWKRMLGYRDEELPNDVSVWEKITHPDDVKEAYDAFDKLVSNTITKFDIEYRMQHKDGHWINVLSRAKIFFNKQQQPIRVVGTHTDVTQTKIAANKLSESEEKLRLIIDNSPLGICINSMDGRFLSTNKAYQKIVGYSKEELQELTFLDLTHPDFVEQNLELYQGMASKKNMGFHIEKKYIRKDGSFIDARVHTGTILANDGEPMFGMAFVEDITELRKTMDDLKLAKEAAEESNALKTEFLHNMSHEIRTPMNGIMGFSNLLSEMAGQNEKQKNYISIIQNCSIQLLRIIDDILEISSLETKQLTILESEFDVNQFMMELFSIFDLKAKERNLFLYLTKELQNECSFIISDKAILEKILDNLLDNAFKFTSSGKIEFGYKIENTNIVFFVKDTELEYRKINKQKYLSGFRKKVPKQLKLLEVWGWDYPLPKKMRNC